jgi:hypothetical protein
MEASSSVFDEKRIDTHGRDKDEAKARKHKVKHDALLSFQGASLLPKGIRVRLGRSAANIRIV